MIADYSEAERTLRLEFPDGRVVEDEIRLGDEVTTRFFSRTALGTSLTAHGRRRSATASAQTLRLVEAGDRATAVDRGPAGAVSLISRASLVQARAARAARTRSTRAGSGC